MIAAMSIFPVTIEAAKMDTPAVLEPPRWPGGPEICSATNRPAFLTLRLLDKFLEKNCPGVHIVHRGKCAACGYYHSK
jgi:hypothetical protein